MFNKKKSPKDLKTQILIKLKNSNCDETQKPICDETQKLQLCCNSKTQIVIELRNSNPDETQEPKW